MLGRVIGFADFSVASELLLESTGMADGPASEYPVWVRQCGEKVNRALFPRVYAPAKSFPSAYGAGVAVGMIVTGRKTASVTLATKFATLSAEQRGDIWQRVSGEESAPPSGITAGEREQVSEIEAKFTPEQQVDFDQGKADAGRMLLGENETTEATQIYKLMLTFWRFVDELPNTQVLFEFLSATLGQNVVGNDPKRVQQLCRRVGKKFRPPGRPRKNYVSDVGQ